MRLIDGDIVLTAIDYLVQKYRLPALKGRPLGNLTSDCLRYVQKKVNGAPTIDAVPVVRCKDCRYNYDSSLNHGEMHPKCDFTDRVLNGNDYCSRGERKDGAECG